MNPSKKVLLIGWDAADWKVINPLMDAGKMPNVQRLVENGADGADRHAAPAAFADAVDFDRHRKAAVQARHPRFLRANAGRAGHSAGDQPLAEVQGGLEHFQPERTSSSVVIGWWPSHPAEPINGVMVSDHYHRAPGECQDKWPVIPGDVHPPELTETLAELGCIREEIVGEMVDPFVPRGREVDQTRIRRLLGLASDHRANASASTRPRPG